MSVVSQPQKILQWVEKYYNIYVSSQHGGRIKIMVGGVVCNAFPAHYNALASEYIGLV